MRNYVLHMSLDVQGALANWGPQLLRRWAPEISKIAGERLRDAEEVKRFLLDQLAMGRKRLPFGSGCTAFSYETGCPGCPDHGGPPA